MSGRHLQVIGWEEDSYLPEARQIPRSRGRELLPPVSLGDEREAHIHAPRYSRRSPYPPRYLLLRRIPATLPRPPGLRPHQALPLRSRLPKTDTGAGAAGVGPFRRWNHAALSLAMSTEKEIDHQAVAARSAPDLRDRQHLRQRDTLPGWYPSLATFPSAFKGKGKTPVSGPG